MPDPADPRTPCLIGWHQRTWPPALRRSGVPKCADADAPEPLDMWEQVARAAATSCGSRADVLAQIQSAQIVYCQSWPYDDPVGRLSARLGMTRSRMTAPDPTSAW